jgi:hypothetical protein
LGWKREHSRDNKNCTVSIYNDKINQWVGKEDTGTESNAEAQKGLASDSFKRACFNWGIGRELYDYPVISIKLNGGGDKPNGCEWYKNPAKKDRWGKASPMAGYEFKLKEWKWYSEFEGKKITFLAAKDNHGKTRFAWGQMKPKTENK